MGRGMKYEGLTTNLELLEEAKKYGLDSSVAILLGRLISEIDNLAQRVDTLQKSLSVAETHANQNRRYTRDTRQSPYAPSKALIELAKNEQR
jgi:hypothetical protein